MSRSVCTITPEEINAAMAACAATVRRDFYSRASEVMRKYWEELLGPKSFSPKPDIAQAPPMSNRKLRHELDALKKEVEELRRKISAAPSPFYPGAGIPGPQRPVLPAPYEQPYPPPQPQPPASYWIAPLTCGELRRL